MEEMHAVSHCHTIYSVSIHGVVFHERRRSAQGPKVKHLT